MTFLARENRQNNTNDNNNRNFGRGNNTQPDMAQMQKKQNQQQVYKQQLQRQIQQKESRKKSQQQKIKRQDQKFMKEIQQIDKKEKQRKGVEKQKHQRILEDINQSPNQKKQPSESKVTRIVPNGNLNLNFNYQDQTKTLPQIPKLGFMTEIQPNQNYLYTNERKRPYLYQENDQVNNYYEQRIRRHKEQLNLKLDELFHHIHSTKDHIKAQEQIDKIKRKLRSKQTPSPHQFQGESQVQLEYQNKFYHVPKPNREPYRTTNQEKSRMLDYQSSSKFSPYKNLESRAKIRTHHDQLYSLPQREQYQQNRGQKWGTKPGKDNFLANREAIDYQAEKTLGQIDRYLEQLGKKA